MIKKLDNLVNKAQITLAVKMDSFLNKKREGDSQLVVALVLIAVAVGLCIIFRNTIRNIMNDLLVKVTGTINNLSNGLVQ